MKLRDYQQEAVDKIYNDLQYELNVLMEAPCSAGKTIIFSYVINKFIQEYNDFRILVLVDREILITQTRDKIIKIFPELLLKIGIVCASISDEKIFDRQITIASRQTLINCLNEFPPVKLIIVDECHLIPVPKIGEIEPEGQFAIIINKLRDYNKKTRLWGVTATPYRLGIGYIYGDKNRPGSAPYFQKLNYKISTSELQSKNWLAPLKGKTVTDATIEADLDRIKTIGGEYNLDQLESVMVRPVHIQSAISAWQEHASNRKKTIVFCVTIDHAEKLKKAFNNIGIPSMTSHSKLSQIDQFVVNKELHNPNSPTKIFCSVAKLTTGMDVPSIDCIIMARATKAAALYKQILGRGQRLFDGKKNCLVLDMVGNNARFGTDLDNLKINFSGESTFDNNKKTIKNCPDCNADLHIMVRVCNYCGYVYPQDEYVDARGKPLKDIKYGANYFPPKKYKVLYSFEVIHKSHKTGKPLLRVKIVTDAPTFPPLEVSIFMCFIEDGYSPFAIKKGEEWWSKLTYGSIPYPSSAIVAKHLAEVAFRTPLYVTVDINGQYPKIVNIEMPEKKEEDFIKSEEDDDLPF